MKGAILINAYFDSDEYMYQPQRLQEELYGVGVEAEIITNDSYFCAVDNGKIRDEFAGYDFCIYLDKDKYLLKALSDTNVPLFNSYDAITVCDDKMMTYLALADKGIPLPKTLAGLMCFSKKEQIKPESVDIIEAELGYPLIVKESYGSQGKGVYLAHDRTELCAVLEKVKCKPHLLQKYVWTSFGKDVRVIVIGGKVAGAMLRQSDKDFRSNIGAGGSGEAYEITPEVEELCLKVAEILGLDYCGIDLLFGEDGFIVCEVNSNAFFAGFEASTGINVAELYAEYIVKNIKNK